MTFHTKRNSLVDRSPGEHFPDCECHWKSRCRLTYATFVTEISIFLHSFRFGSFFFLLTRQMRIGYLPVLHTYRAGFVEPGYFFRIFFRKLLGKAGFAIAKRSFNFASKGYGKLTRFFRRTTCQSSRAFVREREKKKKKKSRTLECG